MITVAGVSMRFGSKVLFEDVTTTFSAGRRYGLTGPNGAGKSTFMKLLTGELPPQKGTVVAPAEARRAAAGPVRLRQLPRHRHRRSWATRGCGARSRSASALYAKADHDRRRRHAPRRARGHRRRGGRLHGRERRGDPAAGPRHPRRRCTSGRWRELQGGQKVRVLLAQALFGHPEALLLDEPTNHLDLDSIHWLREFLVRYDGTLIVISHDRHFLNGVCTHIADIDYQTIITYTGGYDDMVLAKTQIRSRVEADNAQREKKIAQLQRLHRALLAPARAPSQVTSRRKEVERLQTTELARSNIQRPVHQVHDEPAVGPVGAGDQGRLARRSATRTVVSRLQRDRQSRREDRPRRPQRRSARRRCSRRCWRTRRA